ncbi:multiple sugar transport system substrate-binding protein [Paenibacillus cellulosilyticus]|uniref:Multiple sugar transport system substrate-binding protein n=1 Tax=Paenibacillus cellulosilyticus TaxID=375489 RepID=A0A2V2YNR4_9BACL|nr:extracellular solute-binding protein [Paenibacillus cellulosilyticus]PWV97279.1 multiple sugar transport system substrate-binding protein [Paenibacillus cellulosilyticus]QKS47515.1 extracellular solute-binding protein [Paenibacillus cellulosilyticus]
MRRGAIAALVGLLLLLLVLAGCSDGQEQAKEPDVLKVADIDENNFYSMYGDYLNAAYPNTRIEFISAKDASDWKVSFEERAKRWKQLVQIEQPDLIVLRDDEIYQSLADEGLLTDLSPYMQSSGITEQIHPGVLELMKQNRDGLPYGMATIFTATKLYYNEDLFREYGIDLPRDGMTWEELLQLAYRFTAASTSSDAPVGYYQSYSGPMELASYIGSTEGLSMYRLNAGKVTLDTTAWQQVFHTVLSHYKDGTFRSFTPEGKISTDGTTYYDQEASLSADWFSKGRAAMTIGSYGSFRNVKFKLGSVNPPVDASTRSRSADFYANHKLAIRAGSSEVRAAWGFIQFMVSDYVAKVSAQQANDIGVPSRMSYGQFANNEGAAGLYKQMPAITPPDDRSGVDTSFYEGFYSMLKQEISDVLADKQTEEGMLKRMQEQGQKLLDAAKANAGSKGQKG